MRRYDIMSGILLILSIIDFALAAPVLVQEKRQAGIDVVHIPEDVITVLGKRIDEDDLGKLVENFKAWGKQIDSSDTHASLSSVPPGPDHGSTGVVQAPTPNPESSTANSGLMMEPSIPGSSESDSDHEWESKVFPSSPITPVPDSSAWTDIHSNADSDGSLRLIFPGSSESGSEHEWESKVFPSSPITPVPDSSAWADIHPNAGSDGSLMLILPESSESDSDHEWESKVFPSSPNEDRLDPSLGWHYYQGHVQQPNLGIPSSSGTSSSRLTSALDPDPDRNLISAQSSPDPPPSTGSDMGHGADSPPLYPDPQSESASAGSQPVDPADPADLEAAALYAKKGKAKQLRRVPGTARDVGKCGPLAEGDAAC
jgi:hypothetical protein